MEKVVLYARFSSSKQNETSIEAQLKECYEFCRNNDYIVINEYIDRAVSARTADREQFQRMIKDSAKREFKYVICYQFDRFSRDRYDSAIYKEILQKNGVRVLSTKEMISDGAGGIIMESLYEAMAQYYSVELGQKVKRNMKLNAEKGFFNGGYPPFGYKIIEVQFDTYIKKRLEIDTVTAPVVKEIFEMRANGTRILDIVDYLNSQGFKTVQGKEFKKTSLQQILKNKRYIGTNMYNDEEYPNTIPAIIDENLFNKVQTIVEKYKYAPSTGKAKEEYILTTKLFCGECNENMIGISGTSETKKIYYYYTCNGVKKKKCNRRNIPKKNIEDIIINECREILTKRNITKIAKEIYKICQEENSQNCLIQQLENRKKELKKSINNLIGAIEKGQNIDLINNRLNENRIELKRVEEGIEIEREKLINLTEMQIEYFLCQLRKGNVDSIKYRRILVNIFVNRIYLYENKITIIFNVGSRPVTLTNALIEEINTNLEEPCKESYYAFAGGFAVNFKY